jgi:hypothetical protein
MELSPVGYFDVSHTTELHAALADGPGIAEGFEACVPHRSDSIGVGILTCIDRLG